jgi:hypothetical protein
VLASARLSFIIIIIQFPVHIGDYKMSSAVVEADERMMCCASCGISEDDDTKLKKCTACKLVRYCSIECQREHRPQHKKACKKRAAELRDEILFRQPESNHYGDCPICCLPLSIDPKKSSIMGCCSKMICNGCDYANIKRQTEGSLDLTCPFCRHPLPDDDEEAYQNMMNRVEANDPVALREMGKKRYDEGDYKSAFEYYTKAVELGDVGAHHTLTTMYWNGQRIEKDEKKLVYHMEEAAIGGHPIARYNLGCVEKYNGRHERAVKHFIIAANLGHDGSLDVIRYGYEGGLVSKEDFAAALRGHHAAVDGTKNPQREAAEAAQI